VLAYLRKGETFAELAAGFGVGMATAWRYVRLRREALLFEWRWETFVADLVVAGR